MKLKTLTLLVAFISAIKVSYGQHEGFLSLTISDNWVKENQIKSVLVQRRWSTKKGKLKRKLQIDAYKLNEKGELQSDQITRIERKGNSIKYHYEIRSKRGKGEYWIKQEYLSGKKLKRITNSFFESIEYNYNENGKLDYTIDHYQSRVDSVNYSYDTGNKLILIRNTRLDRISMMNHEVKLYYNEENQLIEIRICGLDKELDLFCYRKLRYSYGEDGLPLRTEYFGIEDKREVLECEEKYIYIK